jgi:hypothetical protein
MNTLFIVDPLSPIIDSSLAAVRGTLRDFTMSPDFETDLRKVFGTGIDTDQVSPIVQGLTEPNSPFLPAIEIRSASEINGANGAFAGDTYTIYLSREFLERNRHSIDVVANVLLEEIGHGIDQRLHGELDTPGDEGELFSTLVRGINLGASELTRIGAEDDRTALVLDGRTISVELSSKGNELPLSVIPVPPLQPVFPVESVIPVPPLQPVFPVEIEVPTREPIPPPTLILDPGWLADTLLSSGIRLPTGVSGNDPLTAPVFRFYNAQSRGHFFTTSVDEGVTVLINPQWGYNFEGVGFWASTSPGPNLLPVYRFYNPISKGHFFTISEAEKNNVLANPQWQYNFEGVGFYTYGASASLGSDVYRFYNPISRGHFFTISDAEKNNVLANPQWQYTFEGVGFEAKV